MLEEDVIAIATKAEDSDEMRAKLDEALELTFLSSGPHGVYIPNGQAKRNLFHGNAAEEVKCPNSLSEENL